MLIPPAPQFFGIYVLERFGRRWPLIIVSMFGFSKLIHC